MAVSQRKIGAKDKIEDGKPTQEEKTAAKKKHKPKNREEEIKDVSILQRLAMVVTIIVAFTLTRDYFMKMNKREDNGEKTFVSVDETVFRRFLKVKCSEDYDVKFKGCSPKKCGRVVMDGLVNQDEAAQLVSLAQKGMAHGGSAGGPTILDLHSGALTLGEKFVNIYKITIGLFTARDFDVYKRVKDKIQNAIAQEFGLRRSKLYLTKPTFFSKITPKPAKTAHDEYWHPHVDKVTYGSFYYTSLLYLTDFNKNFTGGRFVFVGKNGNQTVEPKTGRVSFFTSGSENLHHVQKVSSGTRYAITVSFTCDKQHAISNPRGSE